MGSAGSPRWLVVAILVLIGGGRTVLQHRRRRAWGAGSCPAACPPCRLGLVGGPGRRGLLVVALHKRPQDAERLKGAIAGAQPSGAGGIDAGQEGGGNGVE